MGAILDTPWTGTSYSPATPLDIATLEAAIVTQLAGALGNLIEVAHYPNNPDTYRLTHRIGAALVQYVGAEYGPPEEVGLVAQQRTLEFAVVVMMRDLGWAYGGPAGGTSPGRPSARRACHWGSEALAALMACSKGHDAGSRLRNQLVPGSV